MVRVHPGPSGISRLCRRFDSAPCVSERHWGPVPWLNLPMAYPREQRRTERCWHRMGTRSAGGVGGAGVDDRKDRWGGCGRAHGRLLHGVGRAGPRRLLHREGEAAGQWFGAGAGALGLVGEVDADDFRQVVMDAVDPRTGSVLRGVRGAGGQGRPRRQVGRRGFRRRAISPPHVEGA